MSDNNDMSRRSVDESVDAMLGGEPAAGKLHAVETTPDSPRKVNVGAGFLTMVLFLTIAGGAIWYLTRDKNPVENAIPTLQPAEQKVVFYDAALDAIADVARDTQYVSPVVLYYEPTNRLVSLEEDKELSFHATVSPSSVTEESPSSEDMTVDTPTFITQVSRYFAQALEDDGFTAYQETNPTLAQYIKDNNIMRYKKGSVVCELVVNGETAVNVSRACVDTSTIATAAENIEPFYVAYEKKNKVDDQTVISINLDDVTASKIEGYQYVTGGIGGFYGGANIAFVRQTGGEWVFFAARQDMQGCEDYAEELFYKSLAHENCYDFTNGESVAVGEYYGVTTQ